MNKHEFRTKDEAVGALSTDEVYHELTYWVGQPMTMDQWIELEQAIDEAFDKVLGQDADVTGIAGPIPFDQSDQRDE